jgi:hypothetical protein
VRVAPLRRVVRHRELDIDEVSYFLPKLFYFSISFGEPLTIRLSIYTEPEEGAVLWTATSRGGPFVLSVYPASVAYADARMAVSEVRENRDVAELEIDTTFYLVP